MDEEQNIHPRVSAISRYSALIHALEDHRVRTSYIEDRFRVPRVIISSTGSPKLVPIVESGALTSIRFDSPRGPALGVSMGWLRQGTAPGTMVAKPGESVLVHGPKLFNLRVSWPAYPHSDVIRQIMFEAGTTRLELALTVAEQYSRFVERMRFEKCDHGKEGWRLGDGYIALENLYLVALTNTHEDFYEAEVHVVLPRNDPADVLMRARR